MSAETPDVESAVATQNCAPERQDRITVGNSFLAAPNGIDVSSGRLLVGA